MKVILWDIDGTLLRGFGAGRLAFERAFQSVFGFHFPMDTYSFSGATDQKVLHDVATKTGRKVTPSDLLKFFQALPAEMAETLKERAMLPYPGIVSLLEFLSARQDALMAVVTGNLQATASLKLQSGGLESYFLKQAGPGAGSLLGGFGDDALERADIARAAKARVDAVLKDHGPADRPILIGDTPSDIHAGQAIGALTIGVGTGVHAVSEFQALGADYAFSDLSETDRILEILRF